VARKKEAISGPRTKPEMLKRPIPPSVERKINRECPKQGKEKRLQKITE
jgi:hypothetical protein